MTIEERMAQTRKRRESLARVAVLLVAVLVANLACGEGQGNLRKRPSRHRRLALLPRACSRRFERQI